ncbi:F-box/LRR-repeat protein 4 [Anopheles gambiae]|uniref:F-box/LRR-repeat protein 4 n=1 Tax=Anopheles gambiae TaxID=7165 RepID=UPI002AC8A80E|nr:F-box/LRR-repeat protein 4 [Anopheles gambiae]XP_320348.4 F-box/LRR-repeat protein 4 [Anopheles gambiae]
MNKIIEYPTLPVSKEECLQYVLYVAMIHVEIIPDISDTLLVNLIGPPENYTPRAKLYATPKLGTWWQSMPEFGLENVAPEDNAPVNFYFIVKYELSVYPSRVGWYEKKHTGAVVRIWAYRAEAKKWSLLWDCRYDGVLSNSSPQLFCPEIRTVRHSTKLLRFELNTRDRVKAIVNFDGIALVGVEDSSEETLHQSSAVPLKSHGRVTPDSGTRDSSALPPTRATGRKLTDLPQEMLFRIFSHLDQLSLRNVGQVCNSLAALVSDARLYRVVNLRPYWHKMNRQHLQWLQKRCTGISKLDLSWCGNVDVFNNSDVNALLKRRGATLTHLRLNCFGVSVNLSRMLKLCPNLTELCMQSACIDNNYMFSHSYCGQLVTLDLGRTSVSIKMLNHLLQHNLGLQHLNLSYCTFPVLETLLTFCQRYHLQSSIIRTIGEYNRQLISLNLYRTCIVTADALEALYNCINLKELDLGYSWNSNECFDNELTMLVQACTRLQRLGLAGYMTSSDSFLQTIAASCPELQLLDLTECEILNDELNALRNEFPTLSIFDQSRSEGTQ